MITTRAIVFGSLAVLSYVFMFFAIIRFFDQVNWLNGGVMVGAWLATLGLCYLTDRSGKS